MTKRRVVQLLFVILTLASGNASGSQGDFNCESRLQKILWTRIPQLKGKIAGKEFSPDRIREENPISNEISADYRLLSADLEEQLVSLPEDSRQSCRLLANSVIKQFESFFARRLGRLLSRKALTQFHTEYRNLLAEWPLKSERIWLSGKFSEFEAQYMQIGLENLQQALLVSRWADYAAIRPSLERWTDQWSKLLGSEASGAVLFESRRIALQASELDPVTLAIVLFHELSHLADPRVQTFEGRARLSDIEAELYAWRETLAFREYLVSLGVVLPEAFRVLPKIIEDSHGLENWVAAVVGSRRL
jgi:hypothetical protein